VSSFDEKAATWDDDPAKVERARAIADLVQSVFPVPPYARVLDFGAGTGLLSQHLAGHVGALTLVEPSRGMREVIEEKVSSGRLPENTRVWDLDLAVDAVPEETFDLVVTLMTLHHVSDVPRVLGAFAELLDDGGRLAIVDLLAEDGSFHGDGFGGHHGFDPGELAEQLTGFGLVDLQVRDDVYGVQKNGTRYPLFLVTATKA
jgi:cyclopropane fatty-acyl-phospholipid synthase-like methyltransferase